VKVVEIVLEGGYASTLTQGTKITPAVVELVVETVFPKFVEQLNQFLKTKNLPPVQGGGPVGSAFYYKRDLVNNPEKEYGDIDIHFFIPRIPSTTDAANATSYADAVIEFSQTNPDISTDSGRNVVFKLDIGYVQVDLVMAYYENREWLGALTPEHNIKGVISSTIYSSVAEYLNLSISTHGVQAKMRDGNPVGFRQSKNTELVTVSKNPQTWAVDAVKFILKTKGIDNPELSDDLTQFPGTDTNDIKIANIVNAVKGVGHTLELNGVDSYDNFISNIVRIYTDKIKSAIGGSKFEKDTTGRAELDKKKLQQGLDMVQGLFK
jgi:hypothetical protein